MKVAYSAKRELRNKDVIIEELRSINNLLEANRITTISLDLEAVKNLTIRSYTLEMIKEIKSELSLVYSKLIFSILSFIKLIIKPTA